MKPFQALTLLAAIAAQPSMNILRIPSAVKAGETLTIGGVVFEIQTAGHVITTGRTAVNLTASGTAAAASLVLTFSAEPANNDTVTVFGQVYTFKTALTSPTAANEVKLEGVAAFTRDNLMAAINKSAEGSGEYYGSSTVKNAAVTATKSGDTLIATAIVKGTGGNAITVAESSSNLSWAGGATTLAGGVDPTGAEAVDAVVIAINSTLCGLRASEAGTNEILLIDADGGNTAVACTETLAGSNNAFAAAAAYGGRDKQDALPITLSTSRAANAAEAALGFVRFPFNFTPRVVTASVRTSANVAKAWDGAISISGNVVSVDNSGSSDWAAGDVIHITAAN